MNTVSNDLMILQVNCTREKPCVFRRMLSKLDIHRKSIITLTLS